MKTKKQQQRAVLLANHLCIPTKKKKKVTEMVDHV